MLDAQALSSRSPRDRRPRTMVALASVLLLAVAGCTSINTFQDEGHVDLVQESWDHVPGVTADDDGLHVIATGLSIVEQDGEGRQPSPPLNLAGAHLLADGTSSSRPSSPTSPPTRPWPSTTHRRSSPTSSGSNRPVFT